jgi:hypothetical protein
MKIGDVSRPRRFANPARLRWYAFHRSVRFALRMMKAEEATAQCEARPLHVVPRPPDMIRMGQANFDPIMETEGADLTKGQSIVWASRQGPACLP